MTVAYELVRCIVCDSAESDEVISADDAKDEIELLWEYHTKRLEPDVPAEHLMDRVAFSQRTLHYLPFAAARERWRGCA